jgi:hypothetical protein
VTVAAGTITLVSGKCLDILNAGTTNGTLLQLYDADPVLDYRAGPAAGPAAGTG